VRLVCESCKHAQYVALECEGYQVHWVRVAGGLFYAGCLALALVVII
jgi:hypothetical protein